MTGNLWYNVNEKTNLCFFFLGQNFFRKIGISTVQREFCQGREAADAALCGCFIGVFPKLSQKRISLLLVNFILSILYAYFFLYGNPVNLNPIKPVLPANAVKLTSIFFWPLLAAGILSTGI